MLFRAEVAAGVSVSPWSGNQNVEKANCQGWGVNETVVLGIQMTTVPQRSGNGWGILFRYHGTCSGQP
jgi:hypothetical protein